MSQFSGKYPAFVKWALALAVILMLLPEVMRVAAIKAVDSSGVGQASLDDVDFNLFTGELGLDQFELTREGKKTLSLDKLVVNFHWLRLFSGEIGIESISVDGMQFAVLQTDQGDWDVVMPLSAPSAEADEPAEPQGDGEPQSGLPKLGLIRLQLNNVHITVDSPLAQGVLSIDKLLLQRVSSWQEVSPQLEIAARWNDAPIELALSAEPLAEEPNMWGRLAVDGFALASVAGAVGQAVSGVVDLDLEFEGRRHQNQVTDTSIDADLTVADAQLQYGSLLLNHRELSLQTKANASLQNDQINYRVTGSLESQGASVLDQKQQILLLNWEKLIASNLVIDDELNVVLDQLSVNGIDAVNQLPENADLKAQPQLHVGDVTVTDLTLANAKQLVIKSIRVENTQNKIVVQKDGQLQLARIFGAASSSLNPSDKSRNAGAPEPQGQAEDNTQAIRVAINSFSVGGDSYIEWQDLRFDVPVKEKIIIEELTVNGIDQLLTDQPATLNLLGRVGEFSQIAVSGEVKPFSSKSAAKLSGKLEAIDLPGLSPYIETYLGYHLTTGQYDHEFDIDIANEKIKLANKLNLRQLKLKAVDPDKPQPMEQQLDVPLAFALDMLRDGNDNISLDVPIEGKLDDPSINIGNVVNTALGKALKKGATGYLKYALQPYGAVLIAAELVGDQMSSVALDPIVYTAGSGELMPEHSDYIAKVATLMQERPKLTIKLCGQSNDPDRLAIAKTLNNSGDAAAADAEQAADIEKAKAAVTEEQLVDLAKLRANEIKRLFINNGVDSKRVFSCQPQYKPGAINGVVMAI